MADQATIGLLLCRNMHKPMSVSEYNFVESSHENLNGALPIVEEIEHDLHQLQDVADGNDNGDGQ